jgi:hypothetical protein
MINSFVIYTLQQIPLGRLNQWEQDQRDNVSRMGEMRNTYKRLVGKPQEKRSTGKHRHR